MKAYLGEPMVRELNTINDTAFLPNIRSGRAQLPRGQRHTDALAIIPAGSDDVVDPMPLAGPLLDKPVRPYGTGRLALPESIPYVPLDGLREMYESAGRDLNRRSRDDGLHNFGVTTYINWPRGISRPVQIARMDLTPYRGVITSIHELIHASDILRQPRYTSPGNSLQIAESENRATYGSAAAHHALGVSPPSPLDDTAMLLDTPRHYESDAA